MTENNLSRSSGVDRSPEMVIRGAVVAMTRSLVGGREAERFGVAA